MHALRLGYASTTYTDETLATRKLRVRHPDKWQPCIHANIRNAMTLILVNRPNHKSLTAINSDIDQFYVTLNESKTAIRPLLKPFKRSVGFREEKKKTKKRKPSSNPCSNFNLSEKTKHVKEWRGHGRNSPTVSPLWNVLEMAQAV